MDSRLISSKISGVFGAGNAKPTHQSVKYVYEQQSGCGVKVYPNDSFRSPRHLFWEILSCSSTKSISNFSGGFSITLAPTEPWDEVLRPDDFLRIFYGDRIIAPEAPTGAYNFASGRLKLGQRQDQSASRSAKDNSIPNSVVYLPLPGSEYSYDGQDVHYQKRQQVNYLVMHERFIGKIDRVERVEQPGDKGSGGSVVYVVTGRSIGSILEDLSLYYNEFIPGLNAVNVFFNTSLSLSQSPSEFVRDVASVVLSAVPLPQWQLPESLINDLTTPEIRESNLDLVDRNLGDFIQKIQASQNNDLPDSANALLELNRLLSEVGNAPSRSLFSVVSLRGIEATYGSTFNKSFLSSVNTGVYDLLKQLSNNVFNEFWFDLCPDGLPNGGLGNKVNIPTIVMRQRPYDVDDELLQNANRLASIESFNLSKFERVNIPGVSRSLFDLAESAYTIIGPLDQSDISAFTSSIQGAPEIIRAFGAGHNDTINYQMGYSGHERLNGFLCLGSYNKGQAAQTDRIALAENGGFKIDVDSVSKFGLRMMEVSTIYAQPDLNKAQNSNHYSLLKDFTGMIANWYFMNHALLNGRIVTRFLPEARLGVPYKYYQTRITANSPYPKVEIGYTQEITDTYSYGQPITTTIVGIRGVRYNLSGKGTVASAIEKLVTARERVKNFFSVG